MLATLKQASGMRGPAKYLLYKGALTQRVLIQPTQRVSLTMSLQQQRNMSFRRQFLQTPIGRSLAVATIGGTSILALMVLGPFLLIGIGGLTGIVAYRAWRMKKQFLNATGTTEWVDFLNTMMQQQQLFGKEKQQVEMEGIKRLELWAESEQGRRILIEHNIHPEKIVEKILMRASFVKKTTSFNGIENEIKIELNLVNSPGSVLVVTANVDVEGNSSLTDIKLVTSEGQIIQVPLQQQNNSGGRVIEGEFQDVQ